MKQSMICCYSTHSICVGARITGIKVDLGILNMLLTARVKSQVFGHHPVTVHASKAIPSGAQGSLYHSGHRPFHRMVH